MKAVNFGLLFALVASAPAFAESTFSLGYANSKFEEVKLKGFNAQYRYEWTSPISVMISASHLSGDEKYSDGDIDVKYTSLLAGPAYRFNDVVGVYALTGFANSKLEEYFDNRTFKLSKSGFAYGVGVQVNATESFTVHLGYEGTKIVNAKANGFNFGVGYRF